MSHLHLPFSFIYPPQGFHNPTAHNPRFHINEAVRRLQDIQAFLYLSPCRQGFIMWIFSQRSLSWLLPRHYGLDSYSPSLLLESLRPRQPKYQHGLGIFRSIQTARIGCHLSSSWPHCLEQTHQSQWLGQKWIMRWDGYPGQHRVQFAAAPLLWRDPNRNHTTAIHRSSAFGTA